MRAAKTSTAASTVAIRARSSGLPRRTRQATAGIASRSGPCKAGSRDVARSAAACGQDTHGVGKVGDPGEGGVGARRPAQPRATMRSRRRPAH